LQQVWEILICRIELIKNPVGAVLGFVSNVNSEDVIWLNEAVRVNSSGFFRKSDRLNTYTVFPLANMVIPQMASIASKITINQLLLVVKPVTAM
jgi:hypothetical protein